MRKNSNKNKKRAQQKRIRDKREKRAQEDEAEKGNRSFCVRACLIASSIFAIERDCDENPDFLASEDENDNNDYLGL